jgi:hypothetical protein
VEVQSANSESLAPHAASRDTVRAGTSASEGSATKEKTGFIVEFCFKHNRIIANVHDEFSLRTDPTIRAALAHVNELRERRRLKPHYDATRFRLICEPRLTGREIELDLAPIDFAYLIMLNDMSVDNSTKQHVRAKIREIAELVPKNLQSGHPTLNAFNYHPLGVQIVLVTKDDRTLLRKRGEHVLLANFEWEVSYSGYCGDKDVRGRELDVTLTAQRELRREIAVLPADPSLSYSPKLPK